MKMSWLFAALAVFFAASICKGDPVFRSKLTTATTLKSSGWSNKGEAWTLYDYGKAKAGLANNPGFVFRFVGRGWNVGTLVRKFPTLTNPSNLTLTFDAGWGWGAADNGGDVFAVMLLDENGDGYAFEIHRASAEWAAQWGLVKGNAYPAKGTMHVASHKVDATQAAVLDGGGLQTFTITRKGNGDWSLSGVKWAEGTAATFSDTTTTSFSQVVLYGSPNVNDIVFANIKLEADP